MAKKPRVIRKDNPNKRGTPDNDTISSQPHELKFFADKWGVTQQAIKDAKKETGSKKISVVKAAVVRRKATSSLPPFKKK